MKKTLLEERKLVQTVKRLRKNSFTVLDFMGTFKGSFPDEWKALVERFGLFGGTVNISGNSQRLIDLVGAMQC